MRSCPKCGRQYDDTWKVCIKCNSQLQEMDRLTQLENQVKEILHEIERIREGKTQVKEAVPKAKPKAVEPAEPRPTPAVKEDTEVKIGKYLLDKIGIISLVAGIAFFVAYTFRYLMPIHKVAVGYLISLSLLVLGIKIEKKDRLKWYGRGLIGGGWSLAYFTTFAMYHIKATRVIHSQLLDLILLSFVVACMIIHLIKYNSQGVLALTLLLGYITAGISNVSYFTFIYITLLAVVAVSLAYRKKWFEIAMFSITGTYLTHLIWIRPYVYFSEKPPPVDPALFWCTLSFIAVYWIIYNIFPFIMSPEEDKHRKLIKWSVLLNYFYFGFIGLLEFYRYNSAWCFNFAAIIAVCAAVLGLIAVKIANRGYLITPYFTASLALLTVSLPFKFDIRSVNLIWIAEIPVLFYIGMHTKKVLYRIFGWILAIFMFVKILLLLGSPLTQVVLMGRELSTRLFVFALGAFSFYLVRYIYNLYKPEVTGKNEITLSNIFTFLGTLIFALAALTEVKEQLVSLTWALGAFMLFAVGFLLKDKYFRYCAMALIAVSLIRVSFIDLVGLNTLYRISLFICLGIVLLIVSYLYTKISRHIGGAN